MTQPIEGPPHHHWRRPRLLPVLGLSILWVALWSDVTWGNVLAGALVALLVTAALPLPPVRTQVRVRPVGLAALVVRVSLDLLVTSAQVGWLAVRPAAVPRSAIVALPLRVRSDVLVTVVAELISVVPGSFVVDQRGSTLYLHVLDAAGPDGVEAARAGAARLEELVVRALGTDADLLAVTAAPAASR